MPLLMAPENEASKLVSWKRTLSGIDTLLPPAIDACTSPCGDEDCAACEKIVTKIWSPVCTEKDEAEEKSIAWPVLAWSLNGALPTPAALTVCTRTVAASATVTVPLSVTAPPAEAATLGVGVCGRS